MPDKQDLPAIPFASPAACEAWLEEHHATSDGTLLKLAMQGSGIEEGRMKPSGLREVERARADGRWRAAT